MIGALAADILDKLRTVAALTSSTSLSIGGHTVDPNLLQAPLPLAWVTLKSGVPDEPSYSHGPRSGLVPLQQACMDTWAVLLLLPYTKNGDADLVGVQFPLLEAARDAVHGTEAPSGYRWRSIGFVLAMVYDDRLGYELRFTVDEITNQTP